MAQEAVIGYGKRTGHPLACDRPWVGTLGDLVRAPELLLDVLHLVFEPQF